MSIHGRRGWYHKCTCNNQFPQKETLTLCRRMTVLTGHSECFLRYHLNRRLLHCSFVAALERTRIRLHHRRLGILAYECIIHACVLGRCWPCGRPREVPSNGTSPSKPKAFRAKSLLRKQTLVDLLALRNHKISVETKKRHVAQNDARHRAAVHHLEILLDQNL